MSATGFARWAWQVTTVLAAWALLHGAASAHDLRPAFLEIRPAPGHAYDVLWKAPDPLSGQLAPQLPSRCRQTGPRRQWGEYGFTVASWRMSCGPEGLAGATVRIAGLESTVTDALLRLELSADAVQTHRFTPEATTYRIRADGGLLSTVWAFYSLGVQHLLLGFDHLLFIFTVVWLVGSWRKLALAVTAFTLAHSVTLALSTLDIVRVDPPTVEALIALSILLLAYEVARRQRGVEGLTSRYPAAVTFLFGLLHGFGFASALREIGLPSQEVPAALLSFNVGLECGQLGFVAALLGLARLARLVALAPPPRLAQVSIYGVGAVAACWTLERLAGLPFARALAVWT